ncbi:MAG: DUF4097 domain-containing protein [Candidatus Eisenbacteria bacterium]|uniref:DUF4097 domain-containing protein n=1 Tax=Eiseniibacteriota bacterium TaxID=2212470 RepID=A0A538U906_UNCEI|nr:MAG: DUF4097 domain-containing protein [Candidatus Eisenbacteria bacterium]
MNRSHAFASRRAPQAVAILAVAFMVAATDPSAQQRDRYTLEGDRVAMYDVAGELRVEPGTGSAVVVEVVRGGRDAGALSVQTSEDRGIATLSIAFPGRRIVYAAIPGHWEVTQSIDDRGRFKDHFDPLRQRQVRVSGSGSGLVAWADLRILVPPGKSLTLHHLAGHVSVQGVKGDLAIDHGAGDLEVRGVRGALSLDTGSGRATVADLQGDLSVDSGSGGVEISEVRGTTLKLDTGSGSVRATRVDVDALDADTGSGDVVLRELSAERMRLDTGSGAVDVDLSHAPRDITADTGAGSFTLRVPSGFGATFEVDTGSGGVDVGVEHESYEIDHDRVRGKIGDGHGRIRIDGGSGSVRILPGNSKAPGRVGMLSTLLVRDLG